MGGWWAFWVAFAALFAWAVYVDVAARLRRAPRPVVAGAGAGLGAGHRSAVVSLLGRGAGLLRRARLVPPTASPSVPGTRSGRWSATTPAMLVYAPFALATAPTQYGGYLDWRQALASAGADVRQQRTIAWCAGPAVPDGVPRSQVAALWSAFVASF